MAVDPDVDFFFSLKPLFSHGIIISQVRSNGSVCSSSNVDCETQRQGDDADRMRIFGAGTNRERDVH